MSIERKAHPGAAGWLPWLRPVAAEEVPMLVKAAAADGHGVVVPSHVIMKEGEIAGYVSLARVPLLLTWLDTQRVKARDTQYLLTVCENLVAGAAPGMTLCVPCVERSPLRPYMAKLGYSTDEQAVSLHFKKVS